MLNSVSMKLMAASLRFDHHMLGAELVFTVDGEQKTKMPGEISDKVVFASMRAGEAEIMLHERENLLQDPPVFEMSTMPGASLRRYFRVDDVDAVAARRNLNRQSARDDLVCHARDPGPGSRRLCPCHRRPDREPPTITGSQHSSHRSSFGVS
ncbi:MAG: putative glyoxalase superfamily protein PhnB [Paracrocinitomix sp.]|jgi:uncharacterized glyoxalase superfamily protein PhnB